VVLLSSKVSSMWLIGLGAIVGFAAHWLAAR
jgi:hypothetical protein